MESITISVKAYYKPYNYSCMDRQVFEALQGALINGKPTVAVSQRLYDDMVLRIKAKDYYVKDKQ